MPSQIEISTAIGIIEKVASDFNVDGAYFVGGYPRSIAMGMPLSDVHDLDVATGSPQKATELAGFVAEASGSKDYEILHRTGSVRMTVSGVEVDFQGSASHDHVAPYVRIWGVEETPIAKNVFDRDFTINALAMPLGSNEILDITRRGMSDIADKRIASIIPPEESVAKNPLMITRAIKFSCKYGFGIERGLWVAMGRNASKLGSELSPERVAIEAFVLSKYPRAKEMLEDLGISYMGSPSIIEKGKEASE